MVADGYKEEKLGNICNFYLGLTYTPKYVDEGVPFLSVKDITKGYLSFEKTKYISYEEFESSTSNAKPKKGDVIFGRVGTLGRPLIVETDIDFCIFVSLGFIRVNDNLHNRYLKQWMTSNDFIKQVNSKVIGSAQKNLNVGWLKNFKIPLPPLKEQEKIADILSTTDDKIDAIASQIQKAQTLKKGLLQKLLSEGLGHSEFKDSGLSIVYPMRKIPKAWELKTLSDITTKITDGAHFTPTYVEKGIPFLRVTDLKSKDLLASEIKYIPKEEHTELLKRCKPEYGDILYSKNGTIGLTRIVTWDWEFSIFVSLCLIKPNRDLIIPEYLKYYLTSDIVNTQIKIRSKQGTVTNLHLEEIRDFFITIPPLKEQKQIADILSTADEKLEVLRAKKQMYETLKKGLLQKFLSGEVRTV